MNLAIRASLKGWKFLYLDTFKEKNELPGTFKAYKYQQHRWSRGHANLFRKMFMEIIRNKVFQFGPVPLRTYLHDEDIDLAAIGPLNFEDALANDVHYVL